MRKVCYENRLLAISGFFYPLIAKSRFCVSLKPSCSHEKRAWFRYGFWDGYFLVWGSLKPYCRTFSKTAV